MVAMLVLEASAEMRESSSLSPGTILKHTAMSSAATPTKRVVCFNMVARLTVILAHKCQVAVTIKKTENVRSVSEKSLARV